MENMINNNFILHYKISEPDIKSVLMMESTGKSFIHLYYYNDDNDTVYFKNLSVNKDEVKQGIGTKTLLNAENVSTMLGFVYSVLRVKKDSWIYEWYKKLGYKDYFEDLVDEGFIWMQKTLT